ncbi:MAG: glycoside hydrolase family 15 protein [Bdellovibrionales bacterium]
MKNDSFFKIKNILLTGFLVIFISPLVRAAAHNARKHSASVNSQFATTIASITTSAYTRNTSSSLDTWLKSEEQISINHIIANTSAAGTRAGSIIASPSKNDPNYFYNWVRDGALVMDIWMRKLEKPLGVMARTQYEHYMWDYVSFISYGMQFPSYSGPGEPRYNVDGTPNLEPWGRPQNDGPALRASLLIRFIKYLISQNQNQVAIERVWPIVANDLRYVGQNVSLTSVDLWEEVRGQHFYTQVVQRAALRSGAELSNYLGYIADASWLYAQASVVESLIKNHYDFSEMLIVENLQISNQLNLVSADRLNNKSSGLDVATVLAVLHTQAQPILNFDDEILVSTVNKINNKFFEIYSINSKYKNLGVAIGRYPEDTYYGGNPWFLATLAYAEYYYIKGDISTGDEYMSRVKFHTDEHGSMSEQMNRENGYMLSARDLTWNYAAFLTAYQARIAAQQTQLDK